MLKKLILALMLCSATVATNLQAIKTEEATAEKAITTDSVENIDEKKNYTIQLHEIEKCKKLEALLLGNTFDTKRIAAFITSFIIGFGIRRAGIKGRTSKEIEEGIPQNMIQKTYNIFFIPAMIIIHYLLLKQYKVKAIPTSLCLYTPFGQITYAALNHLLLDFQLKDLAKNYNSDAMPECVKEKMNTFIKHYHNENSNVKMNMSARIAFVKTILKQLDEKINKGTYFIRK